MPICKMCKKEVDKLVKSHIVPESFFRAMKNNSDHLLIVSNKKGEVTKKSWIGIYDQEILCLQCEEKFKIVDDYGQDLLLRNQDKFSSIVDNRNNEIIGWTIEKDVDFEKIVKFFLSVLYRASLSERDFFIHISLGPYQEKIKEIIESGKIVGEELSIILRKFDTTKGPLASTLLDPRPTRIDGVKFYTIYLGSGYVAYIKADKQKMPEGLEKISLGKLPKMHIVSGNFEESAEMDIIIKIGEKLKEEVQQIK